MEKYTKSLIVFPIIKLCSYSIIFSHLWMKKYDILLNMVNNFIIFFPRYYMHFRVFLLLIAQISKRIKIILQVKKENITLEQILKKRIDENLDDFLSIIIKILRKKQQLLNVSKQEYIKK